MGNIIDYLRGCVNKNLISISEHAYDRMRTRCIDTESMRKCIKYGKVIEEQRFPGEDLKVLFQEPTSNQPAFYVVLAMAHPFPEVVTVARFDDEDWEYVAGIMKRKSGVV